MITQDEQSTQARLRSAPELYRSLITGLGTPRFAVVLCRSGEVDAVQRYLPGNYALMESFPGTFEGLERVIVVIGGSDVAGWTLDGYVIPRLRSGNYAARELEAPQGLHDKGGHPCLSEDWLLSNLPEGWTYDCVMGPQSGFTITATDGKTLFVPLDLLKADRTASC